MLIERPGQFFICGFEGLTLPDNVKDLIINYGLTGVILFSRNINNINQLIDLTGEIYSLRKWPPVIISIDHEGGHVQRIRYPLTSLPFMREIGNTEDSFKAGEIGHIAGKELSSIGINLNYAPVLDVDSNPENPIIGARSFGKDPYLCAQMGVSYMRALIEERVLACGKHFPGHGDASSDSHLTLPVINADEELLFKRELVPFKAAIDSGIPLIMTAHCLYPAIDQMPATLSKKILNNILREKLNYNGVIITDDLGMKAISDHYTLDEIVKLSFSASVDLLLFGRDPDKIFSAMKILKLSIDKEEVSECNIKEAIKRISVLYTKIGK